MQNLNIAQRLTDLRKEQRFTQNRVADCCHVSRPAYQSYEEGRARPSLETLISLSVFYGYSTIEELLGLVKAKPEQPNLASAYQRASPEMQKIVDFVLNLNC